MSLQAAGARGLWFLVLPLIWLGCQSHPGPGGSSGHLASVLITNQPSLRVEQMTRAVFTAHDYKTARPKTGELMFEKEGTGMNSFVYGDWTGKKVWVRAKVFIKEIAASQQVLLACDGYMVVDHGDAHFEEEHKLTGMHRGRFQELLDEINQRLKFPD